MRKLAILLSALACSGQALAADMAVKAPPPSPPPPCVWCGWYVGLNIGGTWLNNNVQTVGTPVSSAGTFANEAALAAALATTSLNGTRGGFLGGAQVGYNWQLNNSVIAGFEADFQGSDARRGTNSGSTSVVPVFLNETISSLTAVSKSVDYLGTVRARLGVTVTPTLLLYGTGGLAYGGVKSSTTIAQSDCCILPGGVTATYAGSGASSNTRAGWTIGAGLESMFASHWSMKVEYLYYDLGMVNYGVGPLVANAPGFPSPTWVVAAQSNTRLNGNILRIGLDYHFSGGH